MFNCELFRSLIGKDIGIVTIGSSATLSGKVVDCAIHYLILSTHVSNKYYIALDQIQGFWRNEDKPENCVIKEVLVDE